MHFSGARYSQLMRVDKPIGTFLLLWPTLWGLWFAARGVPPISILLIFVAGVILMRSAGCVINDIVDRKWDGHVARTKERPLITGVVKLKEAKILALVLCLFSLICVLFLNHLTLWMSVIALFLTILYPYMKRITYWPQFILGVAFSWGVLMAYTAVTHHLPWEAVVLFLIAMVWTVSYDTIYAMVDRQDDILIGIKSTAVKLRDYDVMFITILHGIVLIGLFLFAHYQQLNFLFYLAWVFAAGLAIYQWTLIKGREPQKCFQAFLNNHWFGAVIFLGIALSISG